MRQSRLMAGADGRTHQPSSASPLGLTPGGSHQPEVTMVLLRKEMAPLDFDSLRIFDYTAGQSFAASVATVEVPPGARHAEAWSRRSDKYYVVSSGEIRFALDGEAHAMKTGDFCFVAKGRRFSYSNGSSEPATLVLVHTPSFDLREEVFVAR